MASCFAAFSKDEILAVNEAAAPTNTKKETIWFVGVYWSVEKKSLLNLQQDHRKMIPETLSIET